MLRLDEKCALVTPENTVSPRRSHNHHNGARALCIPEPWVNPPVFGVTDTMSLSTILPLAREHGEPVEACCRLVLEFGLCIFCSCMTSKLNNLLET